jgi:glycosyltransferase 2 family protein
MRGKVWRWASVVTPVATLALVIWRLGTGPFVDGVRTLDAGALAAAAGLCLLTTVCSAWRWKTVARGLHVELSLPSAVAAYYRSQFLNLTLPGGVLGDVHRGISHGRDVRDVGRGLRAVWWERTAGQVVQIALTAVILLALPSPVQSSMPLVVGVVAVLLGVVALAAGARSRGRSAWARFRAAAARDLREALLARRAWLGIALASAVVVAGHTATFIVAAHTAGAAAPLTKMIPIALLVMMGMVLPSAAGWGPREGITAWAFAAAGLGAHRGVAASVVYGVMVLVASLPGAVVLVMAWVRRSHPPARRRRHALQERAVHA